MFMDTYYNKQMTLSDYQSELYDILLELDAFWDKDSDKVRNGNWIYQQP